MRDPRSLAVTGQSAAETGSGAGEGAGAHLRLQLTVRQAVERQEAELPQPEEGAGAVPLLLPGSKHTAAAAGALARVPRLPSSKPPARRRREQRPLGTPGRLRARPIALRTFMQVLTRERVSIN